MWRSLELVSKENCVLEDGFYVLGGSQVTTLPRIAQVISGSMSILDDINAELVDYGYNVYWDLRELSDVPVNTTFDEISVGFRGDTPVYIGGRLYGSVVFWDDSSNSLLKPEELGITSTVTLPACNTQRRLV